MAEPGTSHSVVSKYAMRKLKGDRREIEAILLYGENEHKASERLDAHLIGYRTIVKEICQDLGKVGIVVDAPLLLSSSSKAIQIDAPPLIRKSVALSAMHDSVAGLLVMEYIRVKRELGAWNDAHPLSKEDANGDAVPQQPPNKAQRAVQQAIHKSLFTLMDQLRKNDKAFFDNLATIGPMGVSRPAHPDKKKGPPSPGGFIEFSDDADLDDAATLAEIKSAALRQLAFVARAEKSQVIDGESEVVG